MKIIPNNNYAVNLIQRGTYGTIIVYTYIKYK